METCNQCGKKVEKLDRFRGLEACEECCDLACDEEKQYSTNRDEWDDHIDLQREMSEGCLGDLNY